MDFISNTEIIKILFLKQNLNVMEVFISNFLCTSVHKLKSVFEVEKKK